MSTVPKRPLAHMRTVASGLAERLAPACHRIEVAGSIRRQREMVGDVEIVAVPIRYRNLLGEPEGNTYVDEALEIWPIRLIKNGQKYKQFSFTGNSGQQYCVDLFLVTPETWGIQYMIRTGSADFSHWMVTPCNVGGAMPDGLRVRDGRLWRGEEALATPEEEDVFAAYGMDLIPPERRERS